MTMDFLESDAPQSDVRRRTNGFQKSPPKAFLYSGHGSQTYHMAVSIYASDRVFRRWMDELDSKMMQRLGYSILKVLYDPMRRKSEPFDDIRFTHPAIFMVEFALTKTLIDKCGPPSCLMGSSLGELTCAVVADAISVEDAIDIIAHQIGVLTQRPETGGMLAIVGPTSIMDGHPELSGHYEIAAIFDESHFVVAGNDQDMQILRGALEQNAIDCIRLPVKHAFHTSWLDCLSDTLDCAHLQVHFGSPKIPVVSASLGRFVDRYSSDQIWNAIRLPLQIDRALACLGRTASFDYVDLGPGSAFVRMLQPSAGGGKSVRAFRILSALGDEARNVENAVELLKPHTDRREY